MSEEYIQPVDVQEEKMIVEKSWKEFRETGLMYFVNHFLQIFGWSFVFEFGENMDILRVYPARSKFRGFSKEIEENSFKLLATYTKENSLDLYRETMFE